MNSLLKTNKVNTFFSKVMFVLSFVLISFSLFSQTDSLNRFDAKGLKHGKWKKVDAGKLVYQGQFNHGNPTGTFTYYYDDGKTVKNISNFYANGKVTYVTSYYHAGKMSSYGKYVNQQKDSIWVYFSDNDFKIAEEGYKLGVKHGAWRQYDPATGKILEEINWKNGKQHGLMQAWTLNGKNRYQINYKDGKADGPYFACYPSGNIYERGIYKNSLKDSITTYYDETGRIVHKRKWNKGMVDADNLWIWSSTGKTDVEASLISYVFEKNRSFTVVLKTGQKVKGEGDWTYLADFLKNYGFFYYTPYLIGSHNAPKRLIEVEEGFYNVVFKQDIGFDVIMNESDLGYLKAVRPKLFKKK